MLWAGPPSGHPRPHDFADCKKKQRSTAMLDVQHGTIWDAPSFWAGQGFGAIFWDPRDDLETWNPGRDDWCLDTMVSIRYWQRLKCMACFDWLKNVKNGQAKGTCEL